MYVNWRKKSLLDVPGLHNDVFLHAYTYIYLYPLALEVKTGAEPTRPALPWDDGSESVIRENFLSFFLFPRGACPMLQPSLACYSFIFLHAKPPKKNGAKRVGTLRS